MLNMNMMRQSMNIEAASFEMINDHLRKGKMTNTFNHFTDKILK
jgi:hypothetical protein